MAYRLTPAGESKAVSTGRNLNRESAVLSYMYEAHGSVEFEEIAGETHMSDEAATKVITRLMNAEYIREA